MYGVLKLVKKRSGLIQDFDIGKLERTINICIQEANEFNESANNMKTSSSKIAFAVVEELQRRVRADKINPTSINMDDIQDTVEDVLYSYGYHNTAKHYMRFKYDSQLKEKDEEIERLKEKIKELEEK